MNHPQIERTLKTGYPEKVKSFGTDIMGDEILEGDNVVVAPDGENILEENLEDYLIEILGFRFIKVE